MIRVVVSLALSKWLNHNGKIIVNVLSGVSRWKTGRMGSAYHQRRTYRQTARDLNVTEDEARRRLRLGLQLLSSADAPRGNAP